MSLRTLGSSVYFGPLQFQSNWKQTLLFTGITVFLFAKVGEFKDYNVTVGSVSAAALIAFSFFANYPNFRHIGKCLGALLLPIIIYVLHLIADTPYAVGWSRFISSYSLWFVSILTIWAAFQPRVVFHRINPIPAIVILTIVALIQYVGYIYFNSLIGFEAVSVFQTFDIFNSYLYFGEGSIRAIGTYYEPSVLGRVIATLITIELLRRQKILIPVIAFVLVFLTTQSFGLLALTLSNVTIYYWGHYHRLRYLLLSVLVLATLLPLYLSNRLEIKDYDYSANSTYVRLVMPVVALANILPDYPFGLPIGANEALVQNTIAKTYDFNEGKITNGFFELFIYFGVLFIPVCIYGLYRVVMLTIQSEPNNAIIILYLLLGTAASSSYLSLESSVLYYLFIAAVRPPVRRLLGPASDK